MCICCHFGDVMMKWCNQHLGSILLKGIKGGPPNGHTTRMVFLRTLCRTCWLSGNRSSVVAQMCFCLVVTKRHEKTFSTTEEKTVGSKIKAY